MDVTVHYVNPVNFEMQSTMLGVCRFKHAHTGEAIAKLLLSKLNKFAIRSKLQNIVTDNAANMSKAFTIAVPATEVNADSTNANSVLEEMEFDDINDDSDDVHEVINVLDRLRDAADSDDVETTTTQILWRSHTESCCQL